MTISPERRTLLPLYTDTRHGSRSFMTCTYRCGNACDKPVPNTSENGHIQDEINKALARRTVLKGTAATGAGALMVGALGGALDSAAAAPDAPVAEGKVGSDLSSTYFQKVQPNVRDAVVTARNFDHDVIIRWGDPVTKNAPKFDAQNQSAAAQREQFGYNCDYVGVVPHPNGRGSEALLCVNHEYTDPELMFPPKYDDVTKARIEMAAHGFSVVEIVRGSIAGSWRRKWHKSTTHNRRFHTGTPFRIAGPAAGDNRLKTSWDPKGRTVLGTLGNCAGGTTPWGTILSGEENFNGYFDASGSLPTAYAESFERYGLDGSGRGWSQVNSRFDLSKEPKEAFRFGWIVEIDPTNPSSMPRKQTMLGRFKHEGANVVIAENGKAVAYMGDDERGDYMYKFVSKDRYREGDRAHNMKLLTKGMLFVAKFSGDGEGDGEFDGTGQWIPLTSHEKSFVDGMSVNDVLINTRLAADKVSPTKMDRPEDVEPNLVNGKVYAALTNNSKRGSSFPPDETNPITSSHVREQLGGPLESASGNRNGYVLELTPNGGNHANRKFTWNLMLVCGDPKAQETYFAGFDKSKVSPISCPDNVTFDRQGNLWISTDGNVLGSNDGIFRVPTSGPERGFVRQFLTVPKGAEACGPLISKDNHSLFFAVQHPGEIDGATFYNQASTWPHTDNFPRPSVCVAYFRAGHNGPRTGA